MRPFSKPRALAAFGLTFCWWLFGCSSDSPPVATKTPEAADAPAKVAADPEPVTTNVTADETPSTKAPATISGIPLDVWPDVWFEDPLAVAGTVGTPVAGNATPTTSAPANDAVADPTTVTNAPSGTAGGTAAWDSLLSGDGIQLEAKDIRLAFKQAFQTVGRYNGNYKDVQVKASVLAVLALVAESHPDSITWQAHSPQVRDLSAKLSAAADGLGRQSYDPALRLYEQLEQLLSGNIPANLPPPDTESTVDEIAPRGHLMKRLQQSDDWMKANTADANGFRDQSEQLRHETAMVALLASVTARKDYDMADEPEYAAQAQALLQSALDARKAAEQSDFDAYSAARDRMTKACTACHLDFRFDAE